MAREREQHVILCRHKYMNIIHGVGGLIDLDHLLTVIQVRFQFQ